VFLVLTRFHCGQTKEHHFGHSQLDKSHNHASPPHVSYPGFTQLSRPRAIWLTYFSVQIKHWQCIFKLYSTLPWDRKKTGTV